MKNKGNTYNKGQNVLLTCNNILYEGGGTLDRILYPIGSIYMSVDSTNPSQLFGGTWEQIKGKYLLAVDETSIEEYNTSGVDIGSWNTDDTTLTVSQIPSHMHSVGILVNNTVAGGGRYYFTPTSTTNGTNFSYSLRSGDVGGGQGHNHTFLPPSFTVYMWYRVS